MYPTSKDNKEISYIINSTKYTAKFSSMDMLPINTFSDTVGSPVGSVIKNSPAKAGDWGLIPELGRSP